MNSDDLQDLANLSTIREHLFALNNSARSLAKSDMQTVDRLVTKIDRLVFQGAAQLLHSPETVGQDDVNLSKKIAEAKAQLAAKKNPPATTMPIAPTPPVAPIPPSFLTETPEKARKTSARAK